MIVSGLDYIKTNLHNLENIIINICQERYVDIEFDRPYDPELKLKIIYDALLKEKLESGSTSKASLNEQLYIEELYSILKRYAVNQLTYSVIYHIALAIELIRPKDANHILRELIQDAKFLTLPVPEGTQNIHIKLLDIYLDIITDEDSIDFIGNYLQREYDRGRLFVFPNFYVIYLRYYTKFRDSHDFYYELERLLFYASNKDQTMRLVLAIDEHIRTKITYKHLYHWLQNSFFRFKEENDQYKSNIELFLTELQVALLRKKKHSEKNNKLLDLALAELSIILNKDKIGLVVDHLKSYCEGEWKPDHKSEKNAKAFCKFLFRHKDVWHIVPVNASGDDIKDTLCFSSKGQELENLDQSTIHELKPPPIVFGKYLKEEQTMI